MTALSTKTLDQARLAEGVQETYDNHDIDTKCAWLVRLRWIAVLAQCLCLPFGLQLGLLKYNDIPIFVTIVVSLALFNLFLFGSKTYLQIKSTRWLIFFQMLIDLIALAGLLALTGGCANPLFPLIYLHAALGPLILTRYFSHVYLLVIITCLAVVCSFSQPIWHLEHSESLPRLAVLAAELFVVIVIWSLTYWFSVSAAHLRQEMLRLSRWRQRADHLRALGALAASFSHEFSTPLNTAKIRLERLARRSTSLRANDDFAAVILALAKCEQTLRELFAADQRLGVTSFDQIELVPFVQRVCERWLLNAQQVKFSFQCELQVNNFVCRVPRVTLARALVDILDNAVEATTSAKSEIEVFITRSLPYISVAIADRGAGVVDIVQRRLGDPFLSTKPGGVGLGLYAVNALMEALGGSLKINRRLSGGTVVTLLFPLSSIS